MKVPYCRVYCDGHELEYVRRVLESGWLTTAHVCFEFEQKMADFIGCRYSCAVNSATAALHLAAEALEIGENDLVFVPSMTFAASAEIIVHLQARPVFLDTEYRTNLITPEILEEGIRKNPNAKALILVHYGGQSARIDEIQEICRAHHIKLIEDAAHAFPSKYQDRYIGSFGDATCFSFYANKTITTAEGGMLCTNSENIYKRAKIMRLHGINRDVWDRYTGNASKWEYDVVAAGYKYNMTDIHAAIGLAQLERAEEMRQQRQFCAEFYYRELADSVEIDLPVCYVPHEDHSWHIFQIVLNDQCPLKRSDVLQQLSDADIGFSIHYKPLHQMTFYKEKYHLNPEDFPNAEKTWQRTISLPIYARMTSDELEYVCKTLKKILKSGYSKVR
ncbi:MAG: DegT/DnrJ/EryC1/StrS family aminotransferase [Planctomycetia bacterium]|nr:DegT/DnrJ/EryC1/StrS family aminotransferase [Planctomycetia bacterium]